MKSQCNFLSITATLTTVGAMVSFLSLLQPPKSDTFAASARNLSSKALVASRLQTNNRREPAASNPTIQTDPRVVFSSEALTAKNQAVDLIIKCQGPQESQLAPGVKLVRLTASACSRKDFVNHLVTNEANGFSATVFPLQESAFTTDYIALSPGINRIRIVHVLNSGESETREFLIERTKL